jgi:hypothetical protein
MRAGRVSPETLLDELQAAESAGAEALRQWIDACDDAALRGGLRVLRARDESHARLARRRLEALGGVPGSAIARPLASLCGVLAAPDVSHRSKLAILLARFPGTSDPVGEVAPAIDDDETRALLQTIGDDDRASVRWLHEIAGAPLLPSPAPARGAQPDTLRVLDAYRAAEAAAAEVTTAWRLACALPGLSGGLETIAEREATHARLLAERLAELGGAPRARLDDAVLAAALSRFAARDVADEEKLSAVLARYPGDDDAGAPLEDLARRLDDDPETREMLRLLAVGEAATIAWLRSYRDAMVARPREVSLRVLDGGR